MQYLDIFIKGNLPQPYEEEELNEKFRCMHKGDVLAREEIIEHNMRFVLWYVKTNFINSSYDLQELASVGFIGLIKSVDTFDLNKGVTFASYAMIVIKNEILMFIRKEKYLDRTQSVLNDSINNEIISQEFPDVAVIYEEGFVLTRVHDILDTLSESEKNIIKYSYGFYDEELTQEEIGNQLGVSQSYVSRTCKRALMTLFLKLKQEKLIIEKTKFTEQYCKDMEQTVEKRRAYYQRKLKNNHE